MDYIDLNLVTASKEGDVIKPGQILHQRCEHEIYKSHSHNHCNPIGIEYRQINNSIGNGNQCAGCEYQLSIWLALESAES